MQTEIVVYNIIFLNLYFNSMPAHDFDKKKYKQKT